MRAPAAGVMEAVGAPTFYVYTEVLELYQARCSSWDQLVKELTTASDMSEHAWVPDNFSARHPVRGASVVFARLNIDCAPPVCARCGHRLREITCSTPPRSSSL